MSKDDFPEQPEEFDTGNELMDFGEETEVETGISAVASRPGSQMAMMGILGLVVIGGLYFAFFSGETEVKRPKLGETGALDRAIPVTAEEPDINSVTSVPDLPAPPPIQIPEPPPPPMEHAIPMVATPPPALIGRPVEPVLAEPAPIISHEDEEAERQRMIARRNSAIMIVSGGGSRGGSAATGAEEGGLEGAADALLGRTDGGDLDSAEFTLKKTGAEQARATLIGRDLSAIIGQGKMIDAVLETAINTDLPGQLRAIVSRDVYAEAGKNVLLPKGTRLIGSYQSDVTRGQRRVQIIWTRAMRPDGVDVAIDSPGTDQLGRSGVEGLVDNKYFELFSNAILITTITSAVAIAAEGISGSDGVSSTTSDDGNSTQSGTPADFAIVEGVNTIGDIGKTLLDELIQIKPTITIDQGARIKVFVNRDLIFPSSIASRIRFVQ